MAENPIQFQKGLSLQEYLARYGREEQCLERLAYWHLPQEFGYRHGGTPLRMCALP